MLSHLGEVAWNDPGIAIPAFLTLITIPLSFSIANGLAFGFVSFAALRILRGEFQQFVIALLQRGREALIDFEEQLRFDG